MDKQVFLTFISNVFCRNIYCRKCKLYQDGNSCENNLENLIKVNPSYVLRSLYVEIPRSEPLPPLPPPKNGLIKYVREEVETAKQFFNYAE